MMKDIIFPVLPQQMRLESVETVFFRKSMVQAFQSSTKYSILTGNKL
jgi:hypothetical protein